MVTHQVVEVIPQLVLQARLVGGHRLQVVHPKALIVEMGVEVNPRLRDQVDLNHRVLNLASFPLNTEARLMQSSSNTKFLRTLRNRPTLENGMRILYELMWLPIIPTQRKYI